MVINSTKINDDISHQYHWTLKRIKPYHSRNPAPDLVHVHICGQRTCIIHTVKSVKKIGIVLFKAKRHIPKHREFNLTSNWHTMQCGELYHTYHFGMLSWGDSIRNCPIVKIIIIYKCCIHINVVFSTFN